MKTILPILFFFGLSSADRFLYPDSSTTWIWGDTLAAVLEVDARQVQNNYHALMLCPVGGEGWQCDRLWSSPNPMPARTYTIPFRLPGPPWPTPTHMNLKFIGESGTLVEINVRMAQGSPVLRGGLRGRKFRLPKLRGFDVLGRLRAFTP